MTRKETKIFQIYLELAGSEPKIWRRIIIPASAVFDELHRVIQGVMGWHDSHLYQFVFEDKRLMVSRNIEMIWMTQAEILDNVVAIPLGERSYQHRHAGSVRLEELVKSEAPFQYEYDFGDSWTVTVKLERQAVLPFCASARCIGGALAGPPEDVGGMEGYEHFLEVMEDSFSDEYEELKEWSNFMGWKEQFCLKDADENARAVELKCAQEAEMVLGGLELSAEIKRIFSVHVQKNALLSEIMEALPVKRLKGLAAVLELAGRSKRNAEELREVLPDLIMDQDLMECHCMFLPEQGILGLERLLIEGGIPFELPLAYALYPLMRDGMVYLLQDPETGGLVIEMPEEVQVLFCQVFIKEEWAFERDFLQLWQRMCTAGANLYGCISAKDLLKVAQNTGLMEGPVALKAFTEAVTQLAAYWEGDYRIEGSVIYSRMLPDAAWAEEQQNRPAKTARYQPKSAAEWLRYEKASYYERTPDHERLEEFLCCELLVSPGDADLLMTELNQLWRIGSGRNAMEILEGFQVLELSEAQMERLKELAIAAEASTRRWDLGGFMRRELEEGFEPVGGSVTAGSKQKDNVFSFQTGKRIGAADPCPCGSGKKFKDCCGNGEE